MGRGATAGTEVTSIAEAISRMEAIEAGSPPSDGVACFNRMYLDVTRQVEQDLGQGYFSDPEFMTKLDVVFANLYFEAVDATAADMPIPGPWKPLFDDRSVTGIEPIQFALAGMNAHINYDLPIAVVGTCSELATTPDADGHLSDYQKVDQLLDGAEQSIRQSFESAQELAVDRHLQAVANLVGNWTINSARDLAWKNALVLWELRDVGPARAVFTDGLSTGATLVSRLLLVAV